jgi:hypothetical protein
VNGINTHFNTIADMDLPTKPAANLFFKLSRWRSFEIKFVEGGGDLLEALDGIELYGCQRGFERAAGVTRWAMI